MDNIDLFIIFNIPLIETHKHLKNSVEKFEEVLSNQQQVIIQFTIYVSYLISLSIFLQEIERKKESVKSLANEDQIAQEKEFKRKRE